MARRFCVLPQGFSNAIALDCKRHRHINVREAHEFEGGGDIDFFDLHPVTNLPRYVQRSHRIAAELIPAEVIRRGAGIYKANPREQGWARRKISSYGAENREFVRLTHRFVTLPGIVWTDDGLVGWFKSDGAAPPVGNPVSVAFKPQTPDAHEAAAAYWRILFQDAEQPFIRTDGEKMILRSMSAAAMRERQSALANLDGVWNNIVAEFHAGPFSESLKATKASELPSTVFFKVLKAYVSQQT